MCENGVSREDLRVRVGGGGCGGKKIMSGAKGSGGGNGGTGSVASGGIGKSGALLLGMERSVGGGVRLMNGSS